MNNILQVNDENYEISILTQSNEEEIQSLCDLCNDYFLMSEGTKTVGNEALNILTSLPPNKNMIDKYVLGIHNVDKKIVGILYEAILK